MENSLKKWKKNKCIFFLMYWGNGYYFGFLVRGLGIKKKTQCVLLNWNEAGISIPSIWGAEKEADERKSHEIIFFFINTAPILPGWLTVTSNSTNPKQKSFFPAFPSFRTLLLQASDLTGDPISLQGPVVNWKTCCLWRAALEMHCQTFPLQSSFF